MKDIVLYGGSQGISELQLHTALLKSIAGIEKDTGRVLIIPPDFTRLHSYGGKITNLYYHMLCDTFEVSILPATGTHAPMTREECMAFFGDIPSSCFLTHDWRNGIRTIGTIPRSYVKEISGGILDEDIPVEISNHLMDHYDRIISIGQVVPHEVVGMANFTKNILVGCGGSHMIHATHYLGALCGIENIMGQDHTPVRQLLDYAQVQFLAPQLPLQFVLTVTTVPYKDAILHGLFIGKDRSLFDRAVSLAQNKNITWIEKPIPKIVAYLDPSEFHSTWVGNKAIYRTRMALADDGELIILAGGVSRFGEDAKLDALIRKYGYSGRNRILLQCDTCEDLRNNRSAVAHLIQGSSDGRFSITYCTKYLAKEDVESVGFRWMDYDDAIKKYDPLSLQPGWNTLSSGEDIYYIDNPALGLWISKNL